MLTSSHSNEFPIVGHVVQRAQVIVRIIRIVALALLCFWFFSLNS